LRKNTADHRQITEALADAYALGQLPDFGALRQYAAQKLDLPPTRSSIVSTGTRRSESAQPTTAHRRCTYRAVRLLEDGRIEDLAALLGGTSGDDQTVKVLTKLAAQHNQQRKSQSIADDRYEIRWEKSNAPPSDAEGDGTAPGC